EAVVDELAISTLAVAKRVACFLPCRGDSLERRGTRILLTHGPTGHGDYKVFRCSLIQRAIPASVSSAEHDERPVEHHEVHECDAEQQYDREAHPSGSLRPARAHAERAEDCPEERQGQWLLYGARFSAAGRHEP